MSRSPNSRASNTDRARTLSERPETAHSWCSSMDDGIDQIMRQSQPPDSNPTTVQGRRS
ncbi:hypothetical protein BDW74DRAFT_56136 [Aspergillus multicolor]|uniref:uncharacterized protein n=1 Tax=Aspergillus multicolor TaxID=41759 RepID=UPI003CCD173E